MRDSALLNDVCAIDNATAHADTQHSAYDALLVQPFSNAYVRVRVRVIREFRSVPSFLRQRLLSVAYYRQTATHATINHTETTLRSALGRWLWIQRSNVVQ